MLNPFHSYLENQVKNATPLELVLLLYNKTIFCLKVSKDTIEKGLNSPEEIKKKAENLTRAVEILTYLKESLDLEKGQDVAKGLNEIYGVLIDELVVANARNDLRRISDAIEVLERLKKAWEEAKCQLNSEKN